VVVFLGNKVRHNMFLVGLLQYGKNKNKFSSICSKDSWCLIFQLQHLENETRVIDLQVRISTSILSPFLLEPILKSKLRVLKSSYRINFKVYCSNVSNAFNL
jgi:hypothetical protein